jgi:hypothetical protein
VDRKTIHIFKENYLSIQDYASRGWIETRRFGDLVEMQEPMPQVVARKSTNMLTKFSQVIKGAIKWRR